ncbi:LysE family translocator [Brevibacillus sp. SYP-B805]|uniref:LysE family translocator n=1 Tax=Brevibacillus sp. SYP-B805 TaxID=1578199 RepID=UPI0013EDA47A|nr:LysE family translocator [Brevibacillus sp. SYP-B805]NGQ93774.1 LysE family translocator [Brevibacillus sp. SYP-B805]
MDVSHVAYFLAACVLLTLMPGPDILFVIMQSISQGRKAGIATALGLCSGVTVHTLAAALGISAIIAQSAALFHALKVAGACYLLYLAWQAVREGHSALTAEAVPQLPLPELYKRGILMNVLNPKVSLFFLAFLPQFVTPGAGSAAMQMIVLGLLFMLQAIVIFTIVAVFAGSLGRKLFDNPRIGRYVNLAKAGLFAFIGIRLVLPEE